MEDYEKTKEEEYFQTISQNLGTLLENIRNISLEPSEYVMLSRRATSEVSSYIRDSLIRPLVEAKTRARVSATAVQTEVPTLESPNIIKGSMRRVLAFFTPLQEIFAAIKEVPSFDPMYYERLIQDHEDVIELLSGFINKLENGREEKRNK